MAGHSHAKNVKRKKEAGDKKRAAAFSRVSRLIISAVRERGKDPGSNPALRTAIEKAKEADMPKENVERAIKRGAGEGEEGKLEFFLFEAYGPEDVAIIIEGSTDNRNRTLGEIKEALKKYNGKLADPGSVKWLFSPKGVVEVEKKDITEEISLQLIESGVEDIEETGDLAVLYTPPEDLEKVKGFFSEKGIDLSSSRPGWKAKIPVSPRKGLYRDLLEELRECEPVENIYTNT